MPTTWKRTNSESYGRGVVELGADELDLVDGEQVVGRLRELFSSPSYAPPLPPSVAAEVLAMSHQGDVDLHKVAGLLEKDAMLAGATLRIAQSPMYAGQRPVQTLREAVVRLGAKGVHAIVLEAALSMRVFKAPTPKLQQQVDRLRRHVVAVGHTARALCNYTALDGDHAFLCGLLHDVGLATSLIAVAEHPRIFGTPSHDALAVGVGGVHEQASDLVARAWQVSPEVQLVVGHHHHVLLSGYPHPMIATLVVAEQLAADNGFAVDPPDANAAFEKVGVDLALAKQTLGLTDKTWELAKRDVAKALLLVTI